MNKKGGTYKSGHVLTSWAINFAKFFNIYWSTALPNMNEIRTSQGKRNHNGKYMYSQEPVGPWVNPIHFEGQNQIFRNNI